MQKRMNVGSADSSGRDCRPIGWLDVPMNYDSTTGKMGSVLTHPGVAWRKGKMFG